MQKSSTHTSIPPTIAPKQAQTLIPLKDMSPAHLHLLLDSAQCEYLYPGQSVFARGERDNTHIYLLYGDILLEDADTEQTLIKGRTTLLPLAHAQPRQYSGVAATDCALVRFDSTLLDKLLTWSQVADYLHTVIARERDLDEDVNWMMQVLHSNLFFKVPPLNVEEIFAYMQPRVVDKDEVIIRQGELGDQCYFIKEGRAEVVRQTAAGPERVASIGEGRCFGEDALVNDAPRNASIIMKTHGVLMCLPKHDFYRLLKEPAIPRLNYHEICSQTTPAVVLVDVRSDEEYAQGHLPSAVNIPLHLLGIKSRLLNIAVHYVCYCDTGRRSSAATHLLREQGFRVSGLDKPSDIFAIPAEAKMLEKKTNYVLRDGVAIRGQ